jgi:hypothetical protein
MRVEVHPGCRKRLREGVVCRALKREAMREILAMVRGKNARKSRFEAAPARELLALQVHTTVARKLPILSLPVPRMFWRGHLNSKILCKMTGVMPYPRRRDMLEGVDREERDHTRREPIRWRRTDPAHHPSLHVPDRIGKSAPLLFLCRQRWSINTYMKSSDQRPIRSYVLRERDLSSNFKEYLA